MTKYKQVFNQMVTDHKQEFEKFQEIHDLYRQDSNQYQGQYNELGKPILDLIRHYESILCGKMEGGGRGIFSSGVAEKFWAEIRAHFPSIDMVGAKIS